MWHHHAYNRGKRSGKKTFTVYSRLLKYSGWILIHVWKIQNLGAVSNSKAIYV